MLKTSIITLTAVIFLCPPVAAGDPADTYPDLHLIPWPKSLKRDPGQMDITVESRVVFTDERLNPLAKILADEITRITGLTLKTTSGDPRPGDIVLKLNSALKADESILMLRNREPVRTTDGAHTIRVTNRAVIEGFDYRATAEGTSTILQLIGKSSQGVNLPKVTIKDWPHADYCGVMLDVARQDHSIEAIKQIVQLCRLYKARYLQLHLTDDQGWTFPSTKYPQLGSKNYGAHGGIAPRVYKLEELKALVAFADARGVTLVPEFEVPGHSGAAVRAMPEVFDAINPQNKQMVNIGCMNISNESLYTVIDTVIGEMCEVFHSSPYFHIGSDEVTTGRLSLNPTYKEFMSRHKLKDDHALCDYFVSTVCEMVKKRDKKAIKWEGLANYATKDVIIMGWEGNSVATQDFQAKGYTTITVPWWLNVPWEDWNMYVCNGARHKRSDSVLGATLVSWEQSSEFHVASLRNLPLRQERTWGPDNKVTVDGFAARFQPLDAVAGKLIGIPTKPRLEASFSTSVGTNDFLDPMFAFDGNEATFYKSAIPPKAGDQFTLTLAQPRQVHALEVVTGANKHGLAQGAEVQVSADGSTFTTVAVIDKGIAKAVLKDNRVKAVRLKVTADQTEPLVVREVKLSMMIEVAGKMRNPGATIGSGNVAVTQGDAEFTYPIGTLDFPVINRGHTLRLTNGGNPYHLSGSISGTGKVELFGGRRENPLVIDGKVANTMQGIWDVKGGTIVLAKAPGVDAMGGDVVVRGSLVWTASDQLRDTTRLSLLPSEQGGPFIDIAHFSDTIERLSLPAGARVFAEHGVLSVRELFVDAKQMPKGVYTAATCWLRGSGYVVVGEVTRVDVAGVVENPNAKIGAGNIAVLKAATTFKLPEGETSLTAATGDFPLTLTTAGNSRFGGFITGKGTVRFEATHDRPLELTGLPNNGYKGQTILAHGVLRLNKPADSVAIPGNLVLGGSSPANNGDAIVWAGDGQIAASADVTLQGTQPSSLNLNGHKAEFSRLYVSKAAMVLTGKGGALRVRQLYFDGKRLADGVYRSPQPWLDGDGSVTVDCRVDAKGNLAMPEVTIGVGNVGRLTGNAMIAYPSYGTDIDIETNGYTLKLDSGNGNPMAYTGSISGSGSIEFYMGPTATGHADAPLILGGRKPNTLSGKFLVKKGRVQLEKPEGTDAISGDVVVGGQGFNDCLFWKNSHQLKDTVTITLIEAGNSGAAYLHLNGCKEVVASLTMTTNNKVKTDAVDGKAGELTLTSLVIGNVSKPAGTYTAATEKWIEGKGKVVVRP